MTTHVVLDRDPDGWRCRVCGELVTVTVADADRHAHDRTPESTVRSPDGVDPQDE